ncbi:MAG TPA: aspartate/glutamate racemase family protein [Paracoccus sp. (in: a-proteobacteria)]|uniref:aspartate/glutamate racemase family protein n=1 Tax=uncultured Paracoccus sp. TaxID=189685 RepID=UPI002633EA84|nr:aspartate/glutamate racemase family protein [uncultured Paracoccus sp.]HMQ40518.1 aspartate/glutamate racemase family protein [Paracoccus sp. (in: a-proteobacteria)]HMR35079.1 aspartate/glutamate racemase family protein [Paracoccus sp. (in: a-proteobacteria)]
MDILVVNPNSTQSMTDKIVEAARQVASPGTVIHGATAAGAPASIEGHYDEAMSLPGLMAQIREAEAKGIDGIVVACFDDPGIAACRELATGPVLGICEAAVKAASMLATSFSVVTTLPRSIPIIEHLIHGYGLSHQCRRVRAAAIPVLALEEPGSNARLKVRDEILRAIAEDHCEAVVLGCAGMADLTAWLSEETGIPVIDGVTVATRMIEALVGAGLKTSKINGYATPNSK